MTLLLSFHRLPNFYLIFLPHLHLTLFPFSITPKIRLLLLRNLELQKVGRSLDFVLPNLLGTNARDHFDVFRPPVQFSWQNVSILQCELASITAVPPSIYDKTLRISVAFGCYIIEMPLDSLKILRLFCNYTSMSVRWSFGWLVGWSVCPSGKR